MKKPSSNRGGFTLIEMSVSTSISVIAATMVITDIANVLPRHRLAGAKQQVIQDFRKARAEAINKNLDVRMTMNNANDSYTIWTDLDRDGNVDAGESVVQTLDADVDLWCFPNQGTFDSQGRFNSTAPFAYLSVRTPNGFEAVHLTPNGHLGDYSGAQALGIGEAEQG